MQQSKMMEDKVISALKEFAVSINSGGKVVADMSSLIDATSQLPLSSFDYWERLIRSEFSSAIRDYNPPKWKVWSKPRETLTWLDLISWDGYKREKTLRALSGAAPNTFFFALAVRRLNDWVPEVREAAREKLLDIAKATDPDYVVEALSIVLTHLNSWGRIQDVDKKVLLQIISQDAIAEAFRVRLIASASGPMAFLFSQLGRTPILDKKIEDIASLAVQPSVRAKAYRSLMEGRIVWMEGRKWVWTDKRYCEGRLMPIVAERKLDIKTPLLDLLIRSSRDDSSVVRRVSAEILIRELDNLGDAARELAELFALDKSVPVSERGRFALNMLDDPERSNSSRQS